MNKKKILIASRAFYPMNAPRAFRATELAKEFARQGHEVTVLTHLREFDYTEFEQTNNIVIEDFVNGKWSEIRKTGIFSRIWRFLLNYLFLYPDIQLTPLLKIALLSRKGYDLLISIAVPYPVHWGVALARKKNKELCKIWVADCGDPFMGNQERKIKHPFYFHFVERWFCNKPDFITVPLEEAKKAYPRKCQKIIRVIPQGFRFNIENNTERTQEKKQFLSFAYAGALSKGFRDPSEFLEFLSFQKEKEFKFVVYTKNKAIIEPFVNQLGDKIEIRDYVPREELLEDLRKMDFLVNIENQNTVQSPSKLIDYAIVGRPILSIKPFELNKEVANEFLNGNYSSQFRIENIEKYKIENVTRHFLDLCKSTDKK